MREIIFRGKDSSGVWLYGNLIDCNGFRSILTIDKTIHTPINLFGVEIVRCKVDEDTIGQFTGLKDKNGIPIYEGDIVRFSVCVADAAYKTYTSEVYYDEITSSFYPLSEYNYCDFEIIGNIHDNPDLLEE